MSFIKDILLRGGTASLFKSRLVAPITISWDWLTLKLVDVRDYQNVEDMVEKTVQKYKRLDVLVYNSGAIWWSSVEKTPMKRFQLMQRVNPEGLYGSVQACLPHFYKASSDGKGKGRIVVISPPIYSRFLRGKTAYAMGKVRAMMLKAPHLTDRAVVRHVVIDDRYGHGL